MKGKNLQPRLLYLARISFRFDGEIKTFTDKQMLRELSTTKPALQQMLKELLQALFADDMTPYIKNPKDATRKLLELINEFSKVAGYKINAQKSQIGRAHV